MRIKCKNCGANIFYVIGTTAVTCEHCNQEYDINELENTDFKRIEKQIKEK